VELHSHTRPENWCDTASKTGAQSKSFEINSLGIIQGPCAQFCPQNVFATTGAGSSVVEKTMVSLHDGTES